MVITARPLPNNLTTAFNRLASDMAHLGTCIHTLLGLRQSSHRPNLNPHSEVVQVTQALTTRVVTEWQQATATLTTAALAGNLTAEAHDHISRLLPSNDSFLYDVVYEDPIFPETVYAWVQHWENGIEECLGELRPVRSGPFQPNPYGRNGPHSRGEGPLSALAPNPYRTIGHVPH
jgi:hypothetical protein